MIKADRNILQRLIAAYEASRNVNLIEILKHELMPTPLSITLINGNLRTGSKAILQEILIANIDCLL